MIQHYVDIRGEETSIGRRIRDLGLSLWQWVAAGGGRSRERILHVSGLLQGGCILIDDGRRKLLVQAKEGDFG